ncbi:hypothetical protein BHUM_05120 [Candidatus Burkholderia humilis]|nr:hypothetical protein BHUM_05120 [Candidatus Burkholderia humilis]
MKNDLQRDELLLVPEYVLLADGPQRDHAVVVSHGKFAAVGPADEIKARYPHLAPVDMPSRLVMPGFIDTHHHLTQSFGKALTFGEPSEIYRRIWVPLENCLDENLVYLSAKLAALEALRGGFTTVCDAGTRATGDASTIASATQEVGVRCVLGLICNDLADDIDARARCHRHAGAAAFVAPGQARARASVAGHFGSGSRIGHWHAANGGIAVRGRGRGVPDARERALGVGRAFDRAAQDAADRASALRGRACGPNADCARDDGYAIGTESACAHANRRQLQPGRERVERQRGRARIADGRARHPLRAWHRLEERRVPSCRCRRDRAAVRLRSRHGDSSCGGSALWLDHTLRGGADALRLQDRIGEIAPGKAADFLLIDLDVPKMRPLWDLTWELVRLADRSQIDAVFVAGKLRLWQGWPVDWDACAFLKEVDETAREVVARAPI